MQPLPHACPILSASVPRPLDVYLTLLWRAKHLLSHPEPAHLVKSLWPQPRGPTQEQARCQILIARCNNASRLPEFKRVRRVCYVRFVPTSNGVSVTFCVPAPSDFFSTSNALASPHHRSRVAVRCTSQPTALYNYPRARQTMGGSGPTTFLANGPQRLEVSFGGSRGL